MSPNEEVSTHVTATKLEHHIISCDNFRRMVISVIIAAVGIIIVPMGFLLKEIYEVKGRQDVAVARLSTIDNSLAAERQAFSSEREVIGQRLNTERAATNERLISITSANVQREATLNARVDSLVRTIDELRRDFHQHEIRAERVIGGEYGPRNKKQ